MLTRVSGTTGGYKEDAIYYKKSLFSAGLVVSGNDHAYLYNGMWYVWCGYLPHTIAPSETPDVSTTKWACVGLLNGYDIYSARNYSDIWGAGDDSPKLRIAIISLIRLGYARFCINAGISVTLLTECLVQFAVDNVPTSFRVHGETAIGSLGRVSELVVKLGIRGLVVEAVQFKMDSLTIRQWCGFAGQKVLSATADTMTVSSDPWKGSEAVMWNLSTNSSDGTIYTRFFEFTTDRGGYYSDNYQLNGDGSVTFTNVHPIGTGQNPQDATVVNFYQSHANRLPEGTYSDDSACVSLSVIENPFMENLWVLAVYRGFSHGLGSGAGPNVGQGNLGVWTNIIVDNALYFIGNTDISPSSPQGLNNGILSNIQLSNVKYGFRARRMYNITANNIQHIYSATIDWVGITFSASELEGFSVVGGNLGWTRNDWVQDTWTPKLFKATRMRHMTVNGMVFGRHDPAICRGAVIDCKDGALFNFTLVGNSMVSVDENQTAPNFGWIETNEMKNLIIDDNGVGYGGDYSSANVLSLRTATNNIANLTGSYFGQRVKTNAEAGIFDVATASSGNCFYSKTQYRDAGKMLLFADVNAADAGWPDNTRNIIPFGGGIAGTVNIRLMDKGTLEGFHRDTVAVDLRAVNFGGQSINIMDGSTVVRNVNAQSIYVFKLVGGNYIPVM